MSGTVKISNYFKHVFFLDISTFSINVYTFLIILKVYYIYNIIFSY